MANMFEKLREKAYNMRVLSLEATTQAGSGHPTSALSAADLVAVLFFQAMHYDPANHEDQSNDRFILSKGHAAPILYAAWEQAGVLTKAEVLTLREFSSPLEGHPTARFSYSEAATGSLGCGLSIGLGMALSTRVSNLNFYTYVLLGDSEMAEGSVWEACELAAFYKVHNLIAILDVNRLGQSTQTMEGHNVQDFERKFQAFGWETFVINGHNIESIVETFDTARSIKNKPSVIIAYTYKGYGLEGIENKENYHGKAFSHEQLPALLESLRKRFPSEAEAAEKSVPKLIVRQTTISTQEHIYLALPDYKLGQKIATRKAYGESITALGAVSQKIISLDAEVKNSTFAEIFEQAYPERFFQCFIAEQNMIGMAEGFASRGFIPFASTFGSFFTRAHDQIRMASIGRSPLRLAGSHVGVSIGQDGPSQMALEDIASMRALPDSIVLYPADAVSTRKLINLMANYYDGISYIRLTRAETPVIYLPEQKFNIGGSNIIKQNIPVDKVCIIAAGITLFEALKAHEILLQENISTAVIDAYSIKPLDRENIIKVARDSGSKIITVEDHYLQGGLGESICYELRNTGITIECLAVRELSRSGKPEELLAYHRIDAHAIIETVRKLIIN
jgi:transketolase